MSATSLSAVYSACCFEEVSYFKKPIFASFTASRLRGNLIYSPFLCETAFNTWDKTPEKTIVEGSGGARRFSTADMAKLLSVTSSKFTLRSSRSSKMTLLRHDVSTILRLTRQILSLCHHCVTACAKNRHIFCIFVNTNTHSR